MFLFRTRLFIYITLFSELLKLSALQLHRAAEAAMGLIGAAVFGGTCVQAWDFRYFYDPG